MAIADSEVGKLPKHINGLITPFGTDQGFPWQASWDITNPYLGGIQEDLTDLFKVRSRTEGVFAGWNGSRGAIGVALQLDHPALKKSYNEPSQIDLNQLVKKDVSISSTHQTPLLPQDPSLVSLLWHISSLTLENRPVGPLLQRENFDESQLAAWITGIVIQPFFLYSPDDRNAHKIVDTEPSRVLVLLGVEDAVKTFLWEKSALEIQLEGVRKYPKIGISLENSEKPINDRLEKCNSDLELALTRPLPF